MLFGERLSNRSSKMALKKITEIGIFPLFFWLSGKVVDWEYYCGFCWYEVLSSCLGATVE
jgi:hypothetical protein